MALPTVKKNSRIFVHNLNSKPYIDMTLKFLKDVNIKIQHDNYDRFIIPGNQKYDIGKYQIEGDWSSASFLMVAGAIGGSIQISGLSLDSKQADKKILEALQSSGALISFKNNSIKVEKHNLRAFSFDATDCPDLFPPLVALACNCNGKSYIKGIERLFFKESNRAEALKRVFTTLGAKMRISTNLMEVEGQKLKGGTIHSFNDHRIAMAAAISAITASNEVLIQKSECVSKSYPGFFNDFKSIGGQVYE